MELFCRLCAKIKSPFELKYSIDDISIKLKECYQPIIKHTDAGYPRSVCETCFQKLDESWKFYKAIENAQENLQSMISKKNETDLEQSDFNIYNGECIKVEAFENDNDTQSMVDESEIIDCSQLTTHEMPVEIESKSDSMKMDSEDNYQDTLQKIGFDDFHDTDDSEPEEKNVQSNIKTSNIDHCKDFLEFIPTKDRMKDGTVNLDKVIELKLNDWTVLKYKCWKCEKIFDEFETLKMHMKQEHNGSKFYCVCSLCSDKRRYPETERKCLHQHVIAKHFAYLSYW